MVELQHNEVSLSLQRPRRGSQIAGAMLIAVAIGVAWRVVRYSMGFPIWGDEAFLVTTLYTRGFGEMLSNPRLECGQVASLGFMWAQIAVTKVFGMSEWALRLPAFVSGLIAMGLFARLASRVLDRRAALLSVAIFAASYYIVRHATEVKPYAWDLCVSVTITSLAWAVHTRRHSPLRWAALGVAVGVGVWLSYPAVFVASGAGAVLAGTLLLDRKDRWRPVPLVGLGCLGLVLGGSFVAMYLNYGQAQKESVGYMLDIKTWQLDFPPMERPWMIPWWLLKLHTGNLAAYPVGGKNFGSSITFVLAAMGCWSMWTGKRRALLAMLLSPLALMFVAAALRKYPYGSSARISQHMAPAMCILAGAGLWWAIRKVHRVGARRRTALLIAVGVILAIAVGGLTLDIIRPHKKFSDQYNRSTMRKLAAETAPGDRWIIFNSLTRNNDKSQYIHDVGGSGARFRYYVHRLAPADVVWAPRADSIPSSATGRTWLIVYRDNKVLFPQEKLDTYLAAMGKSLGKPVYQRHLLTSSKDPKRSQVEAIDVYRYDPPKQKQVAVQL